MKTNRRSLFFLALAGAATAQNGAVAQALADGNGGSDGLIIRMRWAGHWEVCVPSVSYIDSGAWHPGMQFPVEWISLADYLKEVEAAMMEGRSNGR